MLIRWMKSVLGATIWRTVGLVGVLVSNSTYAVGVGGTVQLPGGLADLSGYSVIAVDWFSFEGTEVEAEIDAEGRFQFDLAPSFWAIGLVAEGAPPSDWVFPVAVVETDAESVVEDVTLEVLVGEHTLNGSVRESSGDGIADVVVVASLDRGGVFYDVQASTDESGEFTLKVPAGSCFFSLWGLPFEFDPVPDQFHEIGSDFELAFVAERPVPDPVVLEPLVIEPFDPPELLAGDRLVQMLRVTGGDGYYRFELSEDSAPLPGTLTLHPSLGTFNGVLDTAGEFTFEVVVRERFGERSARQTITLVVLPDTVPPEAEYWTPRIFDFDVGPHSAIRIQFSEPMKPFEDGERPWFHWYVGRGSDLVELDPNLIGFSWNPSRTEVFVFYRELLPIGRHVWALNGDVASGADSDAGGLTAFRDRAGNPVARSGPGEFQVRNGSGVIAPGRGQGIEVFLWRERYDGVDGSFSGDQEWLVGQIQLPDEGHNLVSFGRIVAPDQAEAVLGYTGRFDTDRLHVSDITRFFTDPDAGQPESRYDFHVHTLGVGEERLQLRLADNQFPVQPVILNRDEFGNVSAGVVNEILLGEVDLSDVDSVEVIIGRGPSTSPAIFLNGGDRFRYRATFQPSDRVLTVPADLLSEGFVSYGAVRFINYVDKTATESGVVGRSAFVSSTEFRISTEDPQLIYPVGAAGLRYRPAGSEPDSTWLEASDQQSVPVTAEFETGPDGGRSIDLGRFGRLELEPGTRIGLDGTGEHYNLVLLQVYSGEVSIHEGTSQQAGRRFLVSTASSEVAVSGASVRVGFDEASRLTQINVLAGEVQARAKGELGFSLPMTVSTAEPLELSSEQATVPDTLPTLEIDRAGNGLIRLSWPRQLVSWDLEILRNFDTSRPWHVLPYSRSLVDWKETVNFEISERRNFGFRLTRPEP